MARADLVIAGRCVVTPDGMAPATILISDGAITAVADYDATPAAGLRLDVGEAVVLPGVVDTHIHVNEPGRTEWEGFETATRAAAAGGVTTIVDMPLNSVPVTTTLAALEAKARAAARHAMVDYGFWGGVVPGMRDDLSALLDAGVLGFKCFLVPSGIGEFPHVTAADLRPVMARLAELGAPLLVHAELPGPIERAARARASRERDDRRYSSYLASRPPEAEAEAVDLVLSLCKETGCPVHIVHLSAASALDAIGEARRAGLAVTVETCPHYLSFAAEDIPDGATAFKCAPPIRERANRERLWAGLAGGVIDVVASDHSPAPPALKCLDSGDFAHAWGGIASLELSLAATWTAASARGHTPSDLARWLAEGTARLARLAHRKGRIAPGYDADLVVWDPDASFTVDPARLHHRHPVTPYAGMRLSGVVRRTFVRGTCVYDGGAFPARSIGRWVKPEETGS